MTALCEFIRHENGIQEMRLYAKNRQAVDELGDHMETLVTTWNTASDGDRIYLLIDMRKAGLPPVNYIMHKIREWMRDYRSELQPLHIREAFVVPGGSDMILTIGTTFARVLPVDVTVRFFTDSDYDAATTWLLQDND
jgi:hypothetical protein